jgi:hypothetical protein
MQRNFENVSDSACSSFKGESDMKKLLFFLALIMVVSALTACLPDEHNEILPWCKQAYTNLLVDYPDLPKSFIAGCVTSFQNGNMTAFGSLCGWEAGWDLIYQETGVVITSRPQCLQLLHESIKQAE